MPFRLILFTNVKINYLQKLIFNLEMKPIKFFNLRTWKIHYLMSLNSLNTDNLFNFPFFSTNTCINLFSPTFLTLKFCQNFLDVYRSICTIFIKSLAASSLIRNLSKAHLLFFLIFRFRHRIRRII